MIVICENCGHNAATRHTFAEELGKSVYVTSVWMCDDCGCPSQLPKEQTIIDEEGDLQCTIPGARR